MSSGKIDVIILAGGLGTRLKGIVPDLPKALSPVNGRPFLDYILDFLEESGAVNNVIFAVSYMADQIIERYARRSKYNFKILFSREQTLLGTGGAIKRALHHVTTDDVMVFNGDSYVDFDFKKLIATHREESAIMTVVLKEVENPDRYGTAYLNSKSRITSFNEKRSGVGKQFINTGVYILERKLFDLIEENKIVSLEKELIPVFIKQGIYGYVTHGKFIDIGIPETYIAAQKFFEKD
jgi:D-glycero-alpha-D-manno-heptose 1-phosphate guanylyltransferase